jgi:RHS repeat-associated protein
VVDTRNFAWSPAGELLQRGYTKQGTGVGDMFDYDNHHRLIGSKLGVAALGGSYGSTSADRELAYALEPGQSRDSVTETLAGSGSTLTDYTNEAASPRYSAIGQIAPWYDGEGNLTFDGRLVYVYDFKNRLSEVYELVAADPETEAAMQTFGGVNAPRETLERGRSEIRRRFGEDMSQALAADRSARTSSRLYGSVPSTRSMTSAQTAEFQVVLIAAYGYDPFNRRIVRVVPGEELDVRYSYDGWREVEELVPVSDGGTMVAQARKVMVWGAEFSEILSYHRWEDQGTGQWDWTSYMVSQDEQGSVTWLHRADGSEVEAVEYDPYGKRTVFPAAGGSQARSTVGFDVSYTGHRIDHETGLIYARNRYLHTGWGRFVTFDPLGPWADRGNLGNGYGYVGNMPTTGTDPSGLMSIVGGNGGGGGGAISSGGSSSGGGFEDGVCGGVGGSPGGERAGGAGGAGGNQGEGGGSTPRARTTRCCAPADRVIIIVLYSPTAGRDVFINNSAVEAQKRLKANVGGGIIVTVDEEGALATADYRIPEGVAGEVPAEVVYLPGHGTSVEVPFPEGKKSTGAMLDDNEIVSTKRVADMNRGAIEGFVQLAQRSGVIVHINSAHHITVESCFQGLGEGELVKIDTGGRAFGGQGLVTRHAVSRDASMATAAADMFDHPVFSYKGTIDSSSFDGILPNAFSEPVFVLPMR